MGVKIAVTVALILAALLAALVVFNPSISIPLPTTTVKFSVKYDSLDDFFLQKLRLNRSLTKIGSHHGFQVSGVVLSIKDWEAKEWFEGSRYEITEHYLYGEMIFSEKKRGDLSTRIQGIRTFAGLGILLIPFNTDAQRFESMTKQLEDELTHL